MEAGNSIVFIVYIFELYTSEILKYCYSPFIFAIEPGLKKRLGQDDFFV